MKTLLSVLLLSIVLSGCDLWDWGDTVVYIIPEGKHQDFNMPEMIDGTEIWAGNIVIDYNPKKMTCPENFAYWNKLGGMMPDLTSNFIEGKHQSARLAWRVDPMDTEYIYLGYIVYVMGEKQPHRGYLYTPDSTYVRVKIGEQFYGSVVKYKEWWGVYLAENIYIKVGDPELKGEDLMVVMTPYYGGKPTAPTDITITITFVDTTWLY